MAISENGDLGNVVLGFRPEDAELEDAELVGAGKGRFDATIYTVEHTGEQTLVTIQVARKQLAVKMPKDFEANTNSTVGVQFDPSAGYFFDQSDGARIRTCRLQAGT
ncbi:MAG: TOBE domain-containing protein [Paracoccaceae bacterium]